MDLTIHDVFDAADSCGDHPLGFDKDILVGAETIVAMDMSGSGYDGSDSFAVAKLADGRFFAVEESSDSSGHG